MADHGGDDDFRWTRLTATSGFESLDGLPEPDVFLVQVHSATDDGRLLLNDPLGFFATHIPAILNAADPENPRQPGHELSRDEREHFRASILRLNAERPANPVHRIEVWAVFHGSPALAGVQYKLLASKADSVG
jgi:hypothetical protein